MTKIKRPIVWKLILSIGLPLLVIYSTILFLNFKWNKSSAIEQMKDYLVELTSHNASTLNTDFTKIAQYPIGISKMLEVMAEPDEKEIFNLLIDLVKSDSLINSMAIAFEPYSFAKKKRFAPYVYREEGRILTTDLTKDYDYCSADWYSIPMLLKKPYWSEPYYSRTEDNTLQVTFSVPIYKNNKFLGIASANISLEKLRETMENIHIMGGYIFMISQYGTYIYHPNEKDIMRETIFSKAVTYNFNQMRIFGREMIKGKKSVEPFNDPIKGIKQWIIYTPIVSCNWTLAAVIPEREILDVVYSRIIKQMGVMILGYLVIMLTVVWVAFNITNPIRNLMKKTERLATGDLDVQMVNIRGEDEIHELAMVFNKMVIDLKHYINDLTNATKARESVESELRIARHIQESLIPRIFPPFPHRKEFSLFARNIPAKEVAGDFYDFFFLDEDNLALIIADVSGKGVSASLFMAVTKTLIKAKANYVDSPETIMSQVNYDLCQENDAAMFVTTFMAVLNVKTGSFTYCNAGHNNPYLIKANGEIMQLENTEGMALGIIDDCNYTSNKITLKKNDMLYLYTDGVNEAMDIDGNEFSYAKMEEFLKKLGESTPRETIEITMNAVQGFTKNAEQSDDITIMALRVLMLKDNIK
ncbi:MAG: SpoIIE family protein phosphatase [Candidatus Cloacimonadales bacterium]|nr:SpoIIE family protein phosphatase [Candidatus Cloacimonadales bacterium]